jgi:hypothetical protein
MVCLCALVSYVGKFQRRPLSGHMAHKGFIRPHENPGITMLTELRRPQRRGVHPMLAGEARIPGQGPPSRPRRPEDAALYACGCGESFATQARLRVSGKRRRAGLVAAA